MYFTVLFSSYSKKFIFILLCAIGMLWHTTTAFAATPPPVLWLEPVKTGFLTDGSAYCDLKINSSEPDFALSKVQITESFALLQQRRGKTWETGLLKQNGPDAPLRVISPMNSSAYAFVYATFQGTDYILQTQTRLFGRKSNVVIQSEKAIREASHLNPPMLIPGNRPYAMKGVPVQFRYNNIEKQKNGSIRVVSPTDWKTDTAPLSAENTFVYKVPAAGPMKVDYTQNTPKIIINTVENNGKTLTHVSYVQFFENRSIYRNLQHGLFALLAGGLLTAIIFLWYMRRSPYHVH